MVMTYTQLVSDKNTPGSISDWANDTRIQVSAPVIVDEAQDWIYRRLRHWRMMPPPVTGVLSTSNIYIPIPADMLEPDFFVLTGIYYQVMKQKTQQEVMSMWSYDGNGVYVPQMPRYYWFDSTNFNFDSVPDQAYAYALTYYQQPARLSSVNNTNFLTTWCERLMRTVIMMMVCEWTKENSQGTYDRTYWEGLASKELSVIQAESDRSKRAVTGGWIEAQGDGGFGGWGWPG